MLTFVLGVSLLGSACSKYPITLLVQQVCRHGDRSPCNSYPNYAHKDVWIQGLGVLTPLGMQQMYEGGLYFKQRYNELLNYSTYIPDQINVVSSAQGRAFRSASAFLAAMFPPSHEILPGLNWQPIQQRTISYEIDYYLKGSAYCPKTEVLNDLIISSEQYQQLIQDNQQFMNTVCFLAGYPRNSTCTLSDIERINDCWTCDAAHNLTQPEWATQYVKSRVYDIFVQRKTIYYSTDPYSKDECYYGKGGSLLGLILNNFKKKIEEEIKMKFVYYSGHDNTLWSLMGDLGFPVGTPVTKGSCVIFELNKYCDGIFVEMFFQNRTVGLTPEPITLPGCDERCEFEKFLRITHPLANFAPEENCGDL